MQVRAAWPMAFFDVFPVRKRREFKERGKERFILHSGSLKAASQNVCRQATKR